MQRSPLDIHMMAGTLTLLAALATISASSCRGGEAKEDNPPPPSSAPVLSFSAPAAEPSQDPGCDCDQASPADAGEIRILTDPATGAALQAVGAELTGAKPVSVTELLAHPEKLEGQTVYLEGQVSAMCTHRRAWFTIQAEGGEKGAFVRVVTMPAFLVPKGSIGKRARVEGKVELLNVPEHMARHYARDHRLGDPARVRGPMKSVIIRALGAEFI